VEKRSKQVRPAGTGALEKSASVAAVAGAGGGGAIDVAGRGGDVGCCTPRTVS